LLLLGGRVEGQVQGLSPRIAADLNAAIKRSDC